MIQSVVLLFVVAGLLAFAYAYRKRLPTFFRPATAEPTAEQAPRPVRQPKVLQLSPQARQNLALVSRPIKVKTYWRTILVPGEIVDRPGLCNGMVDPLNRKGDKAADLDDIRRPPTETDTVPSLRRARNAMP